MRRGAGSCSSYAGRGRDADDTARAGAARRFSSRIARSRSVVMDRKLCPACRVLLAEEETPVAAEESAGQCSDKLQQRRTSAHTLRCYRLLNALISCTITHSLLVPSQPRFPDDEIMNRVVGSMSALSAHSRRSGTYVDGTR